MSSKAKDIWTMIGGGGALLLLALSIFISWWFLLGLLVLGLIVNAVEPSPAKEAEEQLKLSNGFNAEFRYEQTGFLGATLLLDPATRRFAVVRAGVTSIYRFDQLVAVEVGRNGSSVHKTNRGNQLAKAAVGGFLLGGAGLLIGGMSGSKRVEEKVSRLSLKIFTSDLKTPVEEIVFFSLMGGAKSDGFLVNQASRQLETWYGRFRAILDSGSASQPKAA